MEQELRVPEIPPRFTDATVVGAGGTSVVFRVWDTRLSRIVALKVFRTGHGTRSAADVRDRELDVAAALADHPNVVSALGAGETADGLPYLVLPYASGGSLHDRVVEQGPLRRRDVLQIGVKLAGALASAHAAGFVHGDIKPANIVFSEASDPWLVDLGAAGAHGRPGERGATAAYVAPEMITGEQSSPPGDIYALGRALVVGLLGFGPRGRDAETADPDVSEPAVSAVPFGSQLVRSVRTDDPLLGLLRRCQSSDPRERPTPLELARSFRQLQRRADLDATEIPLVGRVQPLEEGRDFVEARHHPTGRRAAAALLFTVALVAILTLAALGWRLVSERTGGSETLVATGAGDVPAVDVATIGDRCAALDQHRIQMATVEPAFLTLMERRSQGEFVSNPVIDAVMEPVFDYINAAAGVMVDDVHGQAMLGSIDHVRVIAQVIIDGESDPADLPEVDFLQGERKRAFLAPNHCDVSFAQVWDAEMGWFDGLTV